LLLAGGPTDGLAATRPDLRLVRVEVADADGLHELLRIATDVWTEHPRPGAVDVVVDANGWAALQVAGLASRVLVHDVAELARTEHDRLAALAALETPSHETFFADFRPLSELLGYLDELVLAYPSVVDSTDLGESLEGRPITALRIGQGDRTLLVSAGQHAREWIGVASAACLASRLARDAASNARVETVLTTFSIWIVPIVNPDGYVFSWTDERFWRKNRRDGVGVDLNRNWGTAFGGDGSSADPESGNYRGVAAFSEPETAAVRNLVLAHPEIEGHLDLHSYGQQVLYPWGYDDVPAPDMTGLAERAGVLAQALEELGGRVYTPMQSSSLYPAAGIAPDWMYGERGAWSFTFELSPDTSDGPFETGFVLPPEEILPVCADVMEAVLQFAEALAPGEPPGPGTGTTSSGSGGSGGAAGSTGTGGGSTASSGGGEAGLGSSDGGGSTGDESFRPPLASPGCECRATWARDDVTLAPGWGVLLLGAARRRRRRAQR
jgi:murein tripeptide amidase MpaA